MKNINQSTTLEHSSAELNTKLLKVVHDFQTIFDSYFKALMEYLNAGMIKNANPNTFHEYELGHPTLFNLSNQLQLAYLQLPKNLQSRLLDLEFEVFLHCNNIVDFYSFRIFLISQQRFYRTSTIAERVDAEIKLAKMLIQNDAWNKISRLPKRDLNFYREDKTQTKLMKELDVELQEVNNTEIKPNEIESTEDSKHTFKNTENNNNIFNTIITKLKFGETLLELGNSYVEKSTSLLKRFL
ncbi:hypothetical protein CN490_24860 [Bacillus cereus]|nr:hypothetical protein CN490_24860 [Bacillus cereus]